MAHLSREEILRACGGGEADVEALAAHLATCAACRTLAAGSLGDRPDALKRSPLLKALVKIAGFERTEALDRLLAQAAMAELQCLTRGKRKERVILSRFCRSAAFSEVLLDRLRSQRSRDESESLTSLAVLAAQGMGPAAGSEALKNDRLARIWVETGNARRMRGEWQHAHTALLRAEEHMDVGTGDACIRARWLSITGSLQWDQGRRDEAMTAMEDSGAIYAEQEDWPQVGRMLVQVAHCIADHEPERALTSLDRASVLIAAEDHSLRALAGRIRTDCLITVGRVEDALLAFAESERARPRHDRPSAALRSTFLAARLLEVLGRVEEAEALFESVVTEELDRGLFKDAVLDLVYIFELHLRSGTPARAAIFGARALGELEDREAPAHDEYRTLLARLVDAARGQSLDEEMLRAAREHLRVAWHHAGAAEPTAAPGSKHRSSIRKPAPVHPEPAVVEPLLARARWSRLRQLMRREQRARVARSPEYHTRAFVEHLLEGVRQAPSRDEAEFIASLALQAIPCMDSAPPLKHDLHAQLWTEVANARRVASEWSKASAALLQAGKHLADGSGDPLLRARARSVYASLLADQGRTDDAVAALEECVALYEEQRAWPEVGRTLVQEAHALVDTAPARALALAGRAAPFLSATDVSLRCLAENICTDALITLGEVELALRVFDLAEPRRKSGASEVALRRSHFIAARLLEHLGHYKEAVQLFEAVVADAFDHEAYREAFLDLLYLFSVHLRQGAPDRAVAVCRLAIDRLDFLGLGHEQLHAVWAQLREAAVGQSIAPEGLAEVRQFLKAHWKIPAAKAPRFSFE